MSFAFRWMEFQSTLPRGERPELQEVLKDVVYFNPRSREGSDFRELVIVIINLISIHAPARGATGRERST